MKIFPKRILACLLAMLLCLGLGSVAVTAADAPSVTVTLSYQADDSGLYIAPYVMTVAADLSETFGYIDDFNGEKVSALDAFVAAHVLVFGDDPEAIKEELVAAEDTGYVTKFMGVEGFNSGYFVNDVVPDVAKSTEIFEGDVIELYNYQDEYGADVRVWFEMDGSKITTLQLEMDEEAVLVANGIPAAGYGVWAGEQDVVSGAGIVIAAIDESMGFPSAAFGSVITESDEDGAFTLSFNAGGIYFVSAIEYDTDEMIPFLSPWLVVTVLTAEQAAALHAARANAITALEGSKNPANYRDAEKAELEAIIEAGKAAIGAAKNDAAIAALLADAKAALNKVKTDAQLIKEEDTAAALAFSQKKTDAKAALDNYKNPKDYFKEEQAQLNAAIEAGKAAINAANDEAGVAAALADAKAAMDEIKTITERSEDYFLARLFKLVPEWAKNALNKIWYAVKWVLTLGFRWNWL